MKLSIISNYIGTCKRAQSIFAPLNGVLWNCFINIF